MADVGGAGMPEAAMISSGLTEAQSPIWQTQQEGRPAAQDRCKQHSTDLCQKAGASESCLPLRAFWNLRPMESAQCRRVGGTRDQVNHVSLRVVLEDLSVSTSLEHGAVGFCPVLW